MYKKLFLLTSLVLLLSLLVAPVKADDLNPPPWRGLPGSTTAWYDFTNPAPTGDDGWPLRAPDASQFIPHPEKGDPGNFLERATDDGWLWAEFWDGGWVSEGFPQNASVYANNFSMQVWGDGQTWMPTALGRTGVLNFPMGSWDMYNFWSMQPAKDVWIQLTYHPGREVIDYFYEMEYFTLEPAAWEGPAWDEGPEFWYGPLDEWTGGWGDWWYIWWEEGTAWEPGTWTVEGEQGWSEGWEEGYWTGGDEPVWNILSGDLVPFETIALEGGWVLDKFLIHMEPNPVMEFFGLFPSADIQIDQMVIDTICYVPEPATIALLGLGGLALLRRRRS